jgi:hypothetical protein
MPNRKRPRDEERPDEERPSGGELSERAAGEELVDLSRIEAAIRANREAIAAQRRELEEMRRGRLSAQTIEVLLTDLADIWEWSGQLVGTHRQTRDELQTIGNALRDITHEVRALGERLDARARGRAHWRLLLHNRVRHAPTEAPPLADLDLGRQSPATPPERVEPDDGH